MAPKTMLKERASTPEGRKSLDACRLEIEVTCRICELMKEDSITRAELARRLGVTRPSVTQFLQDGSNLTLETMAGIFHVLGYVVHIRVEPRRDQ